MYFVFLTNHLAYIYRLPGCCGDVYMVNSFLWCVADVALQVCPILDDVMVERVWYCTTGTVRVISPSVSALKPKDFSH